MYEKGDPAGSSATERGTAGGATRATRATRETRAAREARAARAGGVNMCMFDVHGLLVNGKVCGVCAWGREHTPPPVWSLFIFASQLASSSFAIVSDLIVSLLL